MGVDRTDARPSVSSDHELADDGLNGWARIGEGDGDEGQEEGTEPPEELEIPGKPAAERIDRTRSVPGELEHQREGIPKGRGHAGAIAYFAISSPVQSGQGT